MEEIIVPMLADAMRRPFRWLPQFMRLWITKAILQSAKRGKFRIKL